MLKVLVPVDDSEQALRAVRFAASMFKEHRVSQVVLLNVQAPLEQGRACAYRSLDALHKLEEERGKAALGPACSILDDAGATYVAQVKVGEVAPTICQAIAENDCNAVVMGTPGHTAIGVFKATTLANKLVRMSHVPVTIVTSSGPIHGVVVHGESRQIRMSQDSRGRHGEASARQGDGSTVSDITRIAGWLQPQDILFDVDVRDRPHALEVAAAAIGRARGLDPAPLSRALWRREQVGSTALGEGLAIPHARIGGISRPITLFMRAKLPIFFDALDGEPVSQLLVIMVPEDGAEDDHLQLLALVARLFSDRLFRLQLDGAANAAAAADVFRAGIARVLAA